MRRRRQGNPNQPQDQNTGSSAPGEPVFLAVGRLRRPHGIRGEIIMDVVTDFPDRLRKGMTVYVGEAHEPLRFSAMRPYDRDMLVKFDGMETPEAVGRLRNAYIFIKAEDLPELPEGEYYHHQLLGLTALDEAGAVLGTLSDILETGANDVYTIKTSDGKEMLIPATEEVILSVDLERKEIRIRPPEWL
jgi:16S rRNA processing protein RimM